MWIPFQVICYILGFGINLVFSECYIEDEYLDDGAIVIGSKFSPVPENVSDQTDLWTGRSSRPMEFLSGGKENLFSFDSFGDLTMRIRAGKWFDDYVDYYKTDYAYFKLTFICPKDEEEGYEEERFRVSVRIFVEPVNTRKPIFNVTYINFGELKGPWNISIPLNHDTAINVTDEDWRVGGITSVTASNPKFNVEYDSSTGLVQLFSKESYLGQVEFYIIAKDGDPQHEARLMIQIGYGSRNLTRNEVQSELFEETPTNWVVVIIVFAVVLGGFGIVGFITYIFNKKGLYVRVSQK